jgi:hypothetical protein
VPSLSYSLIVLTITGFLDVHSVIIILIHFMIQSSCFYHIIAKFCMLSASGKDCNVRHVNISMLCCVHITCVFWKAANG